MFFRILKKLEVSDKIFKEIKYDVVDPQLEGYLPLFLGQAVGNPYGPYFIAFE